MISRLLSVGVVALLARDPSSCGIDRAAGGGAYAPCNRTGDCQRGEVCHAGVCLIGDADIDDAPDNDDDGGRGHKPDARDDR